MIDGEPVSQNINSNEQYPSATIKVENTVSMNEIKETPINLEIESTDVIRIVLQFLKENNLIDSLKSLQKESGIALNTVDSVESFASDIKNGKWDSVLQQVSVLKLPTDKLVCKLTIITIILPYIDFLV